MHLTVLIVFALALAGPSSEERLFRDQVGPILEQHCVHCHGATAPKGKLSLATAADALRGGESGPAVAPGRPDESLLLEMISGPAPEMPRKAPPLSTEQVALVRRWIERGAPWPSDVTLRDRRFEGETWWAFAPLRRPPVPAVQAHSWVRTPIDAFLLARLDAEGLAPGPEADRRTLIRRLTYDLHGLPPTPRECDDFLGDRAPDAYERLVDRLLASPRYGERWGRHWLDVVHYGDTHGYDKDKRRDHAWPYRDHVIRALNEDMPYGRFVREQIAGDPIATGFIAAGPWDFVGHVELREGTVDKLKARLLDRDDMVSNAIATFTSLTVHCARCHDHKFDPIPQADYYRLQAVFAGVERGDRPYLSPEAARVRAELDSARAALDARRAALLKAIDDRAAGPELARLDAERADLARALAGSRPNGSPTNGYHSGISPTPDAVKWVQVDLGRSVPIDEVRLIPARPTDFRDAAGFGFPLRYRVEIADDDALKGASIIADHSGDDVPNPGDVPVVVAASGRSARFVRVTASRLWMRQNDYVFALGELQVVSAGKNVAAGAQVSALDSIEAGRWGRRHLVDGFNSRAPLDDDSARRREEIQGRLRAVDARRALWMDAHTDDATRSALARVTSDRTAVEARIKALPAPALVYTALSRPPRPIQVLRRGEVEQPGATVGPGALSCVPGLPSEFVLSSPDDEGARRAALGDWLSSPRNVLTWRSIVNRVWLGHFGRGLVETPNDFGRNGARPSHPELLDWLAVEFLEGGESLKALHRLMVRSAAYRQATRDDPGAAARDGENRLLWRMNRRRLDAESIRDSVLAVSGTLDDRMGGPGFELFRFKDDHSPIYDHTDPAKIDDPASRRRTVYRFTVRSVPNPFLETLDCADPNLNTPVRSTTITALQALAMLNDLFILRQSRAFAARLEAEAPGMDRGPQIDAAYRRALGRLPTGAERAALAAYADRHGLANACRLLFNTNEFIFVD